MLKNIQISHFSSCTVALAKSIVSRTIISKNAITQKWVRRQITDKFVTQARVHNFRCRSAFKLLQIHEKCDIFKPGDIVIDCGAAPGSWSQVAVAKTNAHLKDPNLPMGKVIGIDKITIAPVEGATFLSPCDFTTSETQEKVLMELDGDKVDTVLCDMAPNATGLKKLDHQYLLEMAYQVLRFAVLNSKENGKFLIKLWNGDGVFAFDNDLKRFYKHVKTIKPEASRQDSSELYLLARHFKGIKPKNDE